MKPKSWRDILAFVIILIIPTLWVLQDKVVKLPGEVMGALIATWTLVIQFYFRKKDKSNG